MGLFDKFKKKQEISNKIQRSQAEFDTIHDLISKFMERKTDKEVLGAEEFFVLCSIRKQTIPNYQIDDDESQIDFFIDMFQQMIDDDENEIRASKSIEDKEYYSDSIYYTKNCKIPFLEDIKMLKKLFLSKNINISYSEILKICTLFIESKYDCYINENFSTIIEGIKGKSIDKYSFFKQIYSELSIESFPYYKSPFFVKGIIKKAGFTCELFETWDLLEKLAIEQIEELKLKKFELDLATNPMKLSNPTFDSSLMDGYQFEEFLAKMFESAGFKVILTPKSKDQGADLIVEDKYGRTVIQAKKYEGIVSNSAVQEVVAAKQYYKANGAMVITTGRFSQSAFELAEANDVALWDREKLIEIFGNSLK